MRAEVEEEEEEEEEGGPPWSRPTQEVISGRRRRIPVLSVCLRVYVKGRNAAAGGFLLQRDSATVRCRNRAGDARLRYRGRERDERGREREKEREREEERERERGRRGGL